MQRQCSWPGCLARKSVSARPHLRVTSHRAVSCRKCSMHNRQQCTLTRLGSTAVATGAELQVVFASPGEQMRCLANCRNAVGSIAAVMKTAAVTAAHRAQPGRRWCSARAEVLSLFFLIQSSSAHNARLSQRLWSPHFWHETVHKWRPRD